MKIRQNKTGEEMRCYNCGAKLSAKNYCTSCGKDVVLYKKIVRMSNALYNDGLAKAQVRDLSGAIVSLNHCLKFNKKHIQARNLLGLVYFEIGETVSALSQWILSTSFQEEDNIASEYIQTLQSNQGKLDAINQTIHKYNLSLEYCQQGSDDLAVIQLKKLLSVNGHLVKAHQLLGMLYMKQNDYEKAGKQLNEALQIDSSNTMTLQLLKELNELHNVTHVDRISMKKDYDEIEVLQSNKDTIAYKNGNEMIIQPTVIKEHSGVRTMIDIVIGLAVGVALMWFLVMPSFIQDKKSETAKQGNINYEELQKKNAEVDDLNATIATLQSQLDEANGSLSGYTGDSGIVTRLESMIQAYKTMAGGDIPGTFDILVTINRDGLSDTVSQCWQELYDTCSAQIKQEAEKLYTSGSNTQQAIDYYQKLLAVEPENEELMYHCASAYQKAGKKQEAIDMFTKLMEQSPTGSYASKASAALEKLQQAQ